MLDAWIESVSDNDDPYTFDWSKFHFAAKRNDAFVELVAQAAPHGLRVYLLSTIILAAVRNEGNPADYAEWGHGRSAALAHPGQGKARLHGRDRIAVTVFEVRCAR